MVPNTLARKIQFSHYKEFWECEARSSREGTHSSALEVSVVRLEKKKGSHARIGDLALVLRLLETDF